MKQTPAECPEVTMSAFMEIKIFMGMWLVEGRRREGDRERKGKGGRKIENIN